jgi:hypothetical protein
MSVKMEVISRKRKIGIILELIRPKISENKKLKNISSK